MTTSSLKGKVLSEFLIIHVVVYTLLLLVSTFVLMQSDRIKRIIAILVLVNACFVAYGMINIGKDSMCC